MEFWSRAYDLSTHIQTRIIIYHTIFFTLKRCRSVVVSFFFFLCLLTRRLLCSSILFLFFFYYVLFVICLGFLLIVKSKHLRYLFVHLLVDVSFALRATRFGFYCIYLVD